MKPYIELNDDHVFLPQSVDPHKFEVCILSNGRTDFYLLCRKTSKRFFQVTGVLMERRGNELDFHRSGVHYIQRTFPLDKSEFKSIKIDWQASSGPISIVHEE